MNPMVIPAESATAPWNIKIYSSTEAPLTTYITISLIYIEEKTLSLMVFNVK